MAKRVIVFGRVQGVYFRDSCRREALAANVAGWIRNRHDGTVEAMFEGQPADVERMVAWTRTGPPQAVVSQIEVFNERPVQLSGFSITA